MAVRASLLAGAGAVLLALAVLLLRPPIRFTREEVTLTIRPQQADVRGWYSFRNPSAHPLTATMFYPIPRGNGFGPARLADAWLIAEGVRHPLPLRPQGDRYLFSLALPPRGRAVLEVHYQQPLSGPRARYILRTTWLWLRPLDEAILHVLADPSLGPLEINHPMTSEPAVDGLLHFRTARRQWLPLADLEVTWRTR